MFSEEQKEQYRQIKAPLELKNRITAMTEDANRKNYLSSYLKIASTMAACLLVVVAVHLLGDSTVKIYVSDQQLTKQEMEINCARVASDTTYDMAVLLDIKTKSKLEITVDDGVLLLEDDHLQQLLRDESIFIDSDTTIEWQIMDNTDENIYYLKIIQDSEVITIKLVNEDGQWFISQE